MEAPGIDPGTSRMLSERSTIWATPPFLVKTEKVAEAISPPRYFGQEGQIDD